MFKKFLLILIVLFGTFFVVGQNVVYAENSNVEHQLANKQEMATDCDSLFGNPDDDTSVAYFLQQIFNIMKYAGPILCLVLSISDFVKATASQDKDALSKATKTTGKRIVYALILYFIPTLINFIFPLLGWYDTCGIK